MHDAARLLELRRATCLAVLIGTAKPMPTLPPPLPPVAICELMPITRPAASSSGPPELPGLIAASVWMTSSIVKPFGRGDLALERGDDAGGERAVEAERVADRDHRVADLQRRASRRARSGCSSTSLGVDLQQREVGRRRPCRPPRAGTVSSSPNPTVTSLAPSTTWSLVRMWPSSSITKPEPVASPRLLAAGSGRTATGAAGPTSARMKTTPGASRS